MQATIEAETAILTAPSASILGTGWISLAELAEQLGRNDGPTIAGLEDDTLRADLDRHAPSAFAGGWCVKVADLPRIIGPDRAALVESGDVMVSLQAARAFSGVNTFGDHDMYDFLMRRGVEVSLNGGRPTASRGSCLWLCRALQIEERPGVQADDWWDETVSLPAIQGFLGIEPGEDDSRYSVPHGQLRTHLGHLGIRWREQDATVGRFRSFHTMVCGFDLYRIAGVELAGMPLDGYRLAMASAVESAMAT